MAMNQDEDFEFPGMGEEPDFDISDVFFSESNSEIDAVHGATSTTPQSGSDLNSADQNEQTQGSPSRASQGLRIVPFRDTKGQKSNPFVK